MGDWNAKAANWRDFFDAQQRRIGALYDMVGEKQCFSGPQPQDFTVTVQLVCAAQQGALTISGGASCAQNWTLPTPLACGNAPDPNKCGFDGLDFTALAGTQQSLHWASQNYTLSVCAPLSPLDPSNAPCLAASATSAVCRSSSFVASPHTDLGEWDEAATRTWKYINEQRKELGVQYMMSSAAATCLNGGTPMRWVTTLQFACAPQQGELTLLPGMPQCYTVFRLPTPLACPQ